jgi:hypothetical protein
MNYQTSKLDFSHPIIQKELDSGEITYSQACNLNDFYLEGEIDKFFKMLSSFIHQNNPLRLFRFDDGGFGFTTFMYSSRCSSLAKENIVKALEEALAIVKGDIEKELLDFLGSGGERLHE